LPLTFRSWLDTFHQLRRFVSALRATSVIESNVGIFPLLCPLLSPLFVFSSFSPNRLVEPLVISHCAGPWSPSTRLARKLIFPLGPSHYLPPDSGPFPFSWSRSLRPEVKFFHFPSLLNFRFLFSVPCFRLHDWLSNFFWLLWRAAISSPSLSLVRDRVSIPGGVLTGTTPLLHLDPFRPDPLLSSRTMFTDRLHHDSFLRPLNSLFLRYDFT